jgi:hypothetical protein
MAKREKLELQVYKEKPAQKVHVARLVIKD